MLQQLAFFILFAVRVFYQPDGTAPEPRISHFHAREMRDQLFLEWTVEENEAVRQFVLEKSDDGRQFSTVALVFGSDRPQADVYRFKEREVQAARYYRVRVQGKDNSVYYSSVLQVSREAISGGHPACAIP